MSATKNNGKKQGETVYGFALLAYKNFNS